MSNEEILARVRHYGYECAQYARAWEVVLKAPPGVVDEEARQRAEVAFANRAAAFAAVEAALAKEG